MESNELNLQQNRDRLIESRLTSLVGGWLGGGGIDQKRKRPHGHGQSCGDCWVEGVDGRGRGNKGDKW